jgi:hypothetical protein
VSEPFSSTADERTLELGQQLRLELDIVRVRQDVLGGRI